MPDLETIHIAAGVYRPAARPRTSWISQIVRDTGLTAADAWTVATTGQHGGRYDPQPVTRSSE